MQDEPIDRRALLAAAPLAGLGVLAVATEAGAFADETTKFRPIKTPEEAQVAAVILANRIHRDKDFAEHLRKDPLKVLKEMGLDDKIARDLISQDAFLRQFAGKASDCMQTCDWSCLITCMYTSKSNLAEAKLGVVDPAVKTSKQHEKLVDNLIRHGFITAPTK
jgi:hypothetical protein